MEHLQATATLSSEATLRGTQPWCEGIPERAAPGDEQNLVEHHSLEVYSRHWRTRSIFPSLSPASSTPGSFIRPRRLLSEKYTEGLHPERPARGAVLYTGQSRPCIEHKGPPSTKNMHTKDGHDSRGRNYKAETQLPTFAWASLPI